MAVLGHKEDKQKLECLKPSLLTKIIATDDAAAKNSEYLRAQELTIWLFAKLKISSLCKIWTKKTM